MLSRRIVQFSAVPVGPGPLPGVTKTVGASGADFLTIQAALSWFQSNHNFDDNGIARIQIIDTGVYTFSSRLDLDGISGTPSITAYLEITSNAANPLVAPTIDMTHTSNAGWYVYLNYTWVHNLRFELNNTGSSTEFFRVHADNVLINRNEFIALTQTSDQDGLYIGNWSVSNFRCDHCVFIGFARGAIHLQNYSGVNIVTADLDFLSIAAGTEINESDGGGIVTRASDGSTTVTAAVHNTLGYDYRGNMNSGNIFHKSPGSGTVTWNGSNNIADDVSAENKFANSFDSVAFIESSPASGKNAWLTEIDDPDERLIDLSIAGENAFTVTQNGVSRVGSEPDPRQDFSVDILGNPRNPTTPDIGAYEFQG